MTDYFSNTKVVLDIISVTQNDRSISEIDSGQNIYATVDSSGNEIDTLDFNVTTSYVDSSGNEIDTLDFNVTTSYDIIATTSDVFHYDMKGLDVDCGSPTFRYWTSKGAPDFSGALYDGTKCGATPLANISIVRKFIKEA